MILNPIVLADVNRTKSYPVHQPFGIEERGKKTCPFYFLRGLRRLASPLRGDLLGENVKGSGLVAKELLHFSKVFFRGNHSGVLEEPVPDLHFRDHEPLNNVLCPFSPGVKVVPAVAHIPPQVLCVDPGNLFAGQRIGSMDSIRPALVAGCHERTDFKQSAMSRTSTRFTPFMCAYLPRARNGSFVLHNRLLE